LARFEEVILVQTMTLDELSKALHDALMNRSDIRLAVLFGSAVRDPERARDFDLAVSFRSPVSLFELGELEGQLEVALGKVKEVDLVDLDQGSTLLRREVAQTGRLVFAGDPDAWGSFHSRAAMEWDDLQPFFERESEGLRQALSGVRWSGSIS
jgi:predicted nucleotidyltransferase